jgi:hypothetical protein
MSNELLTVSPNDDTHLDCPVLTKTRVVTVDKGVCAIINWEVRDRNGDAVDLSDCFACPDSSSSAEENSCGQVIFRFGDILGENAEIHQVIGSIITPSLGTVQVELTSDIVSLAGVFTMQVGISVRDLDDPDVYKLVHVDKGMLSVERGLFGITSTATGLGGAPTIGEIRMAMRDTAIENQLLDAVEFDDAEIVFALTRPLRYWNETPPPVAVFTATTFPFHEMWLRATIAQLLKTSAYWYERNKLPASHGGITVDDMGKANPYIQVSMLLQKEWEDFVITKKVQINAGLAMGHTGSTYGSGYW